MIELSDHSILSQLGGLENSSIISILEIDNNELQVIKYSLYYELDKFKFLVNEKKKLVSIFILNMQSIYAKFYQLEAFIEELHYLQYKFNVICVKKCWISDQTYSFNVQLPGYDCITQLHCCTHNVVWIKSLRMSLKTGIFTHYERAHL